MSKRHQHIEQLVKMIDQAEGIFDLPWRRSESRPINLSSMRPYRGINTLSLMVSQMVHDYKSPYWLTFKQALNMDGCVRKGEKGTKIIFYKPIPVEQRKDPDRKFIVRFTTAFNLDQIDGIDVKVEADQRLSTIQSFADARAFCANIPVPVEHGGDRACYIPSQDKILMPEEASFFDTPNATASQNYLATLLHEHIHGTGHSSRLDRFKGEYNIEARAKEELIAEAGAALLSIDLGITISVCDDHAQYLAHWKKHIKDDPNFLIQAISQAEKAIDVLTDYQTEMLMAAE